jgi:hypothetical protein
MRAGICKALDDQWMEVLTGACRIQRQSRETGYLGEKLKIMWNERNVVHEKKETITQGVCVFEYDRFNAGEVHELPLQDIYD